MIHPTPAGQLFCVSIHDVSASTWLACEQLINLPILRNLPLTLLLVPDWHRQGDGKGPGAQAFIESISAMQEQGYEHPPGRAAGPSNGRLATACADTL
jgi:predicted deacetylase